MNPFQISANDVQAFECELGDDCPVIAWGTPPQNYKIIPGSVRLKRNLQEGGFDLDFDFSCLALVSTWVNGGTIADASTLYRSIIKTSFQYQNENFRFESVEILAGGTMVRLNGNASKGAAIK